MQIFLTIIILLLAAMYFTYIIHAMIYSENEVIKEAGYLIIMLTIMITIAFIVSVWVDYVKTTDQLVVPTIKVENTIVNDSIIKSDTTYIYTFKK